MAQRTTRRNTGNRFKSRRTDADQTKKCCHFCVHGLDEIDYTDNSILINFLSENRKIIPRKYTGTCSKHQRTLSQAVKRSRIMAFIQFVPQ